MKDKLDRHLNKQLGEQLYWQLNRQLFGKLDEQLRWQLHGQFDKVETLAVVHRWNGQLGWQLGWQLGDKYNER